MTIKLLNTMNRYLHTLLCLFLFNLTIAQNTNCIQFENLDHNTNYGSSTGYAPDDVFYVEQGVPVSLQEFYYEDGTTGFWNVNVNDEPLNNFVGASGQRLSVNNINLKFDFAEAGHTMSEVCFAFYDGGGEENFAVNGSDHLVVSDLSELPNEINNVSISIDYTTPNNTGVICLSGEIQTLIIGGQEFELDALCFSSLEDCIISNISVEPQDCTPNGIFYVDVAFQHQNEGTQGYKIFGNGQVYGNFDYEDPLVTIGPFVGNGTIYELIIEDNEFTNCQSFTGFQSPICETNCPINNLEAYTVGCSNELSNVVVDFDVSTLTDPDFFLYINDDLVGEFEVSDLPIYLPELNLNTNEIIVQVCLSSPNCCANVPLYNQTDCNDCITFEELTPGDIFGEQAGNLPGDTILSNEQASIVLQPYIYEVGSTGFVNLFVEQDNTFPSSNNSVMVSPNNINMEVNFDTANAELERICFEFYDLGENINIGANGEVVIIEDYNELNGLEIANGVFVEVFQDENFDFPAGTICLSGSINQITIGGQEILIDNICYDYLDESCEISELLVSRQDCENDSFMVELSFIIDDSTLTTFEVLQNGQSLGSFDFTPTPTLLGPFIGDGSTQYEFTVVTANCSKTNQLGGIDCEDEDCIIENIAAYVYGCAEDEQPLLWLDFDVINAFTPFFYIDVNDEFIGEYTFSEFPIILDNITPVTINGVEGFQVFVRNSNNPTPCVGEFFVEAIDCGDGDCIGYDYLLSENILEEFGPEPNTFFYEENNVAHYTGEVITPGIAFGIYSKNKAQYPDFLEAYGRFLYLLNHRVKMEFPAGSSNVTFDWFTTNDLTLIQVNDNEEVHVDFNLGLPSYDLGDISLEVEYIDASLGVGSATIIGQVETLVIGGINLGIDNVCFESLNCEISNITKTIECDPITNTYDIEINFDFENTNNQFLLTIPGAGISNVYSYNNLPISLTGLTYMSDTDQILIADLNGNPNGPYCSASADYEIPCMQNCDISELVVEAYCNDNNALLLDINFDVNNPMSDFFEVYDLNGNILGYFEIADLPITIENYPDNGANGGAVEVCINDVPNCCATAQFDAPSCLNNCTIYDLTYEVQPCENGEFSIHLIVNGENLGNQGFSVFGDGNNYGSFDYGGTHIELGPFAGDGQMIYEFIVKDNQFPDCQSDYIGIGPVDCSEECSISELVVEAYCNDNNALLLDINFDVNNPMSDFFEVYDLNGNILGYFEIADLPITIENYPDNGANGGAVEVCINDVPNCCATAQFDAPSCLNNCTIYDLTYEVQPCENGEFSIHLIVNGENLGNQGFSVFGDGNNYGSFDYGGTHIELGPFAGDGQMIYEFIVKDNQFPDCQSDNIGIGPIDCSEECSIDLTSVEIYDCEDGLFYIGIVAQAENGSPNGLSVVGNGANYGDFDYGFIFIGPLQGDGQTIYEFVLQDNSQPDCQLTFELDEVVDCESDCEIQNLLVEASCNEEGGINVDIDFEYPGSTTNNFFSVYTFDGDFIASFPIASLPVTIEDYPVEPNTTWATVKICINDSDDCCAYPDFEIPNCSDDCSIQNVFAEVHDCDENKFLIDVEVIAQNPGPLGYFIFINNEIAGPFSYSSAFVTVGPFDGDGTTIYNILVIDISDPSCYAATEVGPIDCDPNACQISGILAEASECDEEGYFTIDLTFDYNNVGISGFSVVGNGLNYGTFEYAELPLTFGPFEGSPDITYEFAVFDNDNPSCGSYAELGPVTCPEPCTLSNASYQIECVDDSFNITIDFDHENTGEKFHIDGITNGFFFYDDLPITLSIPLADYNTEVAITDFDDPECTLLLIVEAPCCNLFSLETDLQDCDEDGGLYAAVTFDHLNTQDSFLITYGNENGTLESGVFAYADLPVTVGPIYPNPSDELLFQVIDESLYCSTQTIVEAPYCNNTSCVEFEMIDGFVFGPNSGYGNGDLIGFEDEVKISYLFDDPNCENCNVFVLEASTYPQFENASGQITALVGGGIALDFANVNEPIQQLSIDFYELGNWTKIQVNDGSIIEVDHLANLPVDIAAGVQVEVSLYPNDPAGGSLIFTGEIENINIYSNFLLLDNACFESMVTPDLCMDFEVLDPLTNDVVLADSDDLGQVVYEEDGVKVSAEPMVFQGGSMPFETIILTPAEACDPTFINATDNRLFLIGAMKLDFSEFEVLPDYIQFDIAQCSGTNGINIGINGEERYIGFLEGLPSDLAPNVTLTVIPSNNVVSQGTIILEGDINELIIGGWPVRVDNICYNGVPEDEDVWPGDANSDNIARHFDLLNIGVAYGEEGPARLEDATEWSSFPADNWNNYFANGTNYKHADCNGDGIVNELDREAIIQNYNLTHGPIEDFVDLPATDTDPPILVDFPDGSQISSGTVFEVPVIFGTEEHPVHDIYGVAFTVEFDPTIFDPASLTVEYPVSWFGEPDVNTLHVHKIYDEGKIEIALTRIDQNEVSGYGPIVSIRGIIDDIVGISNDVEVRIDGVLATDIKETKIPIQSITELVPVELNPMIKGNTKFELFVFPNPTNDVVNIAVNQDYDIQSVEIFNSQSHLIATHTGNTGQISLEELPDGIYTFKIKVEGRVFYKRIVKI